MFPVPMRKCPNLCQSAKGWGWRASALWWCAQGVGKPSSSPALEWKGVGKPSLRPVLVCKGCPSLKRMPAFVTSTDHIRSDHCYNQSSHATSSMGLKGRALLWLMWITSSKRSALSLTCRTYATFMHPPPQPPANLQEPSANLQPASSASREARASASARYNCPKQDHLCCPLRPRRGGGGGGLEQF